MASVRRAVFRLPFLYRSRCVTTTWPGACPGTLGSFLRSPQPIALLPSNRWYSPMTPGEIDAEKRRVERLTNEQVDQELRQLNREIARLEMLKAINTGELFTWRGRYKNLARDYGLPLMVWYWTVWTLNCAVCYAAIGYGDVDVLALIARLDYQFGWDMASRVSPDMGKLGLALLLTELAEPLRVPLVVFTVKPVVDRFFPPKY